MSDAEQKKSNMTGWKIAVTSLIATTFLLLGMVIQSYELRSQVITNTVEISVLKAGILAINEKLDRLLIVYPKR